MFLSPQFCSHMKEMVIVQPVSFHSYLRGKHTPVAPLKDVLMGIAGVLLQPTLTKTKNMDSVLTEVRALNVQFLYHLKNKH